MTALVRAPLCGEILGAADTVTVLAAMHPLSPARETLQAPVGLSVAEIVELALERDPRGHTARALAVSIGTDAVPRERWASVRPKAGSILVLRALPRGNVGSLFKSIAMLAVAILTAFVAPYLTPILGTFGTAIVSAAITVGAGLLLNALFPVNAKAKDAGTTYSIAGNQNLATPYQPIPVLHGQMRVYPRYGGSAYTEFEGDNQILRLLYVWGYGPMDVADIKIGETPIESFHDVSLETFYGYPGDPQPTIYPTTVVQQDLNLEVKEVDGWTRRTTPADVTEWAVDFAAPNGLSATKESGEVIVLTVNIEVQESPAYAEDWQPVTVLNLSGKSTKPIRLTVRHTVAEGRYDVRWKRSTPDTDDNPKLISTTVVTAMRGYRASQPITFDKPIALTAIRIRATSQLSGIVDNLNAICTSRVRSFTGGGWADNVPSARPADQLIRVLQGPANPRPIASSRIDWTTIQEWSAYCDAQGFRYNKLHTDRQSVLDTAQDVASAGRAAIVFRDGMWSVVWDAADAPVVQHFTPRNSWDFKGKRSYRRLPDAYRVKFKNEDRGWQDDEIVVYADGYSAANAGLFEELEFPGLTDHTLNWRQGRYHDAQVRLRPEEYRLNVDIEHLICTRGDRVRVTHDLPSWGLASARVLAVAGNKVSIDDTVTMEGGKAYCARFRLADGTGVVLGVATVPGESSILTVDGGTLPAAGDLMMFGEVGQETVILRVKGITPGDDMSAELLLVDDAPGIALADTLGAGVRLQTLQMSRDVAVPVSLSAAVSPIAALDAGVEVLGRIDPATLQPTNLRIVEGRSTAADGYQPTVTFLWEAPAGGPLIDRFEVALKGPDDAAFGDFERVEPTLRSASWTALPAGLTAFQVRSVFVDRTASAWSTVTAQVVSWSAAPPAVAALQVALSGGIAWFSWDAPERVVARLELRYSPATSGATWETAGMVVSRANGLSAGVPFAAGTYLAKFVNGGGIYSEAATALLVTNPPASTALTLGEVFDYGPFEGQHSGTVEADGGVRLAADAAGGIVAAGVYQPAQVITLDAVGTVRLSGTILAHGLDTAAGSDAAPDIYGIDPAGWSATIEVRTTLDDPASASATWSAWKPLTVGDFTGRAFGVRVALASLSAGISPVVELVELRAEVDPRTEVGTGVAVPAAGTRVAFNPAFQATPAIIVTIRDPASGDRLVFGGRDPAGFDLAVHDAADAAVARTIDFIATGFGRRAG